MLIASSHACPLGPSLPPPPPHRWCLGVSGFTGWLAFSQVFRPWLLGDAFCLSHPLQPSAGAAGGPVSGAAARAALRLAAASACALNAAGHRDRLFSGGYGLLGVCLDSVAAVQRAASGRCSLYPLLLGGDAKAGLIALYREAAEAGWRYAPEAAALAAALRALPCDALPEPSEAASAAARALACLPERSLFAAVRECRDGLQAALAAAHALAPPSDGDPTPVGLTALMSAAAGGNQSEAEYAPVAAPADPVLDLVLS